MFIYIELIDAIVRKIDCLELLCTSRRIRRSMKIWFETVRNDIKALKQPIRFF